MLSARLQTFDKAGICNRAERMTRPPASSKDSESSGT